jgi:hypothetical protein
MVLAQPENQENKCEFDQFIVTGGAPVPAICGTNTGAHSKSPVTKSPQPPTNHPSKKKFKPKT